MNIPLAISVAWEIAKQEKKSRQYYELLMKFDKVLSLNLNCGAENKVVIPEEIAKLLEDRELARENKDFELSDKLRDKIKENGYAVKDTKNGQEVEKI